MKKTTTKKRSALNKLIPATCMLLVSATMVVSSTYAWFTMNKEVDVRGLQMQATTSDGLEVSLGAIGPQTQSTHTVTVDAPTENDTSWRRAITVGEYYSSVGKLMPASSDDAYDIFYVDAADVFAGGHAVTAGATITSAQKKDSASLTKQSTYTLNGTISTSDLASDAGYYLDVPMWIRASNREAKDIYATITVSDPNAVNGSDLVKAVRVAIIPVTSSTNDSSSCTVSFASTSYASDSTDAITVSPLNSAPNASSSSKIFGLKANGSSAAMDNSTATDWPTYHGKVIKAAGNYDASGTTTLDSTTLVAARGLGETSISPTSVFKIPAADADSYACVGFVARIWLEGESIYCEDATANQDWNIDFHFSTDNTTLNNPNPVGTYTITRTGSSPNYVYTYNKADGATFPTSGAYTWQLNSSSAGTYDSFLTALASADFSSTVTVTVAAST